MADSWEDVEEDEWEQLADAPVVLVGAPAAAAAASTAQWDDEEEDDDDDDDQKPATTAPAPRNREKQAKQLTKPKDAKKAKKVAKAAVTPPVVADVDEGSTKLLNQQREIAADYDSAVDLFSDSGERTSAPDTLQTFENLPLKLQKDFAKLTSLIIAKTSSEAESPHYQIFVKELVRQLLTPSTSDEVKDVVRTLNALATEKVTAEKSRPKKKKGFVKRLKDDELEEDMVDGEYDAFM